MVEKLEVQILGEGNLPEELNKSTKALGDFDKQIGKTETANKSVIGSFTELNSMISVGREALQVAEAVYDETVGKTMEYNRAVLVLARNLGISTEETSRLIQASDDLGVSQDTVKTALQMLAKNGIAPNIANLAKLSDELLAIQDPAARAEAAAKKFGKQWAEFGPVILAGSEKIKELTAAQSDGLVVTEDESAAAEELRKKIDELNDKKEALALTIGTELIPAVSDFVDILNGAQSTVEIYGKTIASAGVGNASMVAGLKANFKALNEANAALDAYDRAAHAADKSILGSTINLDKYTAKVKLSFNATDALNFSLSEAEKVMSELAFTMGGPLETENRQFIETQEDLRTKADELKAKIDELRGKRWLGKEGKEQLDEYKSKLDEVKGQIEENAAAHDEATKRIMFDLLQQRLAVDGLTLAESNQLVTVGNAWGLIDDVAVKMWDANNNLTNLLENKKITVDQWAQAMSIAAQNGWDWAKALQQLGLNIKNIPDEKTVKINIKYQKFGEEPGPGAPVIIEPGEEKVIKKRKAAGGPVSAGIPYLVGEMGPELFIPSMSGQIIPNQITNNFNLSVNTVQSAGRIAEDFALMRALAG
jgi:hypothetical protein